MEDEYPRPPTVPKDAAYVGGSDGGVYLLLKALPAAKHVRYEAMVFSDQTGRRLFEGYLQLIPDDSPPIDPTDVTQFAGWSGSALYLVDGRKLLPVPQHVLTDLETED